MYISAEEIARRFPRAHKYNGEWVREGAMGGPPLWIAEWLAGDLGLKPGMRVLDLGCGKAKTSVFLAREHDVEVWATDLWVSAAENWQRVRDAGVESRVYPIRADAHALPFAPEFFDAITTLDCYSYFGTDDLYLNYLVQFVKPGGPIGIAGAGLTQEMPSPVPEHLREMWTQDFWCLHSADWWRRHWERTGLVDLQVADDMSDAWKIWHFWQSNAWPESDEHKFIEQDAGRYLTYNRMIGRRRAGVPLAEYVWPDKSFALPLKYEQKEMLAKDV